MTDFGLIDLTVNGSGLQAYFGVNFVLDSAFPDITPGDRLLAHPTPGGGLLLQPVDALDEYPVAVDSPPDALVEACARGAPAEATRKELAPTTVAQLSAYASQATSDTSDDSPVPSTSTSTTYDHEPESQTQR